jgi:archaeosortase A (PGF-CTERM-specific)
MTEPTAKAPIEFTWKGRVLSKKEVVQVYLVGSLAVLALGIALNYFLTHGAWYTVVGTGNDQYLTDAPYDVFSGSLLVVSLVFLGFGFFARRRNKHKVRALGFVLFGFYWATQAMKLYFSEEGDFVNAIFAAFAVFFFNYFAYHEVVSFQRDEDPRALQWLAGTAFITTGVYFLTHKIKPVANWLIMQVADQTQWLLRDVFHQATMQCGGDPRGSMIIYPMTGQTVCSYDAFGQPSPTGWFPIQIILACTAIQSIMIFVGGIFALKPPRSGEGLSGKLEKFHKLHPTYNVRRTWAFLLTVPLIYVLNLFRNVIIIWMSGQKEPVWFSSNETAFWFSHNVIGKGGSLVALIIIAFIVFQILPELYDSIIGLLDLKERRGPLETWFGAKFGRRGKGGKAAEAPGPGPSIKPVPDPGME